MAMIDLYCGPWGAQNTIVLQTARFDNATEFLHPTGEYHSFPRQAEGEECRCSVVRLIVIGAVAAGIALGSRAASAEGTPLGCVRRRSGL